MTDQQRPHDTHEPGPCDYERFWTSEERYELDVWRDDAAQFTQRLQPLIDEWTGDARRRVQRVVDSWRRVVHARLRSFTQLTGSGDGRGGARAKISVEDSFSAPLLSLLKPLPPTAMELLFLLPEMAHAAQTLRRVEGLWPPSPRPTDPWITGQPDADIRRTLADAARILDILEPEARRAIDALLRRLLPAEGRREDECEEGTLDLLGAYFIRERRIELYWIPIWLCSRLSGWSIEDLSLVVLIHEMAHLYTHVGKDADGDRWDDGAMVSASQYVVEGIAQFYTELICERIEKESPAQPLTVFRQLMPGQPPAYREHRNWAIGHRKRVEVVRTAFVDARSRRIGARKAFAARVVKAEADLP